MLTLSFAFAGSVLAVRRILGIVVTVPKIKSWKSFLAPLAKVSNWWTHHFSLSCFSLLQLPSKENVQSQMLLLVDTQQRYYKTKMKQDMEFGFEIKKLK